MHSTYSGRLVPRRRERGPAGDEWRRVASSSGNTRQTGHDMTHVGRGAARQRYISPHSWLLACTLCNSPADGGGSGRGFLV